ncbi:MAG: J domain-containing protein [Rhodospirillum sp.]|nr:J domain-containing protein [Rhodospirillum sp.]MCF8487656.1 J domain-containing protein [Rhodospirillum sp.]MCF8503075.1 J domain-containing protein [Rhodospirillum sp.]
MGPWKRRPALAAEVKHSYTVPCASSFRDEALALADRRRVNVGDLARSVMLVVPPLEIEGFPDPGEPQAGDRETVVLKSGPSEGRPWRRKPRLQVRMIKGVSVPFIRRAIGLALAMEQGAVAVSIGGTSAQEAEAAEDARRDLERRMRAMHSEFEREKAQMTQESTDIRKEVDRLRSMVEVLMGDPIPGGINSHGEALFVMGFAPGSWPDSRELKSRFRMLATIHHPDSGMGSHVRMSQLNQAMEYLRNR